MGIYEETPQSQSVYVTITSDDILYTEIDSVKPYVAWIVELLVLNILLLFSLGAMEAKTASSDPLESYVARATKAEEEVEALIKELEALEPKIQVRYLLSKCVDDNRQETFVISRKRNMI